MTTSDSINELAAALAKAQAAMKNAPLNKENPHFHSRYADLAGIRDAVIPALSAQGLAVVQVLDVSRVLTRLIHASGQWIESACPLPPSADMQKLGSAITYARRYSLSALCCIAADDDDDANAAETLTLAADVVPTPPDYEQWLLDLEAVADEGTETLRKVWKTSQPYLRQHLTTTDPEAWEALKQHAAAVTAEKGRDA